MITQIHALSHQIGDNIYHLLHNPNASTNEMQSALLEMIKMVAKIEERILADNAAKAAVEKNNAELVPSPEEQQSVDVI